MTSRFGKPRLPPGAISAAINGANSVARIVFHWMPTIAVESGDVYFHHDGFDCADKKPAATNASRYFTYYTSEVRNLGISFR